MLGRSSPWALHHNHKYYFLVCEWQLTSPLFGCSRVFCCCCPYLSLCIELCLLFGCPSSSWEELLIWSSSYCAISAPPSPQTLSHLVSPLFPCSNTRPCCENCPLTHLSCCLFFLIPFTVPKGRAPLFHGCHLSSRTLVGGPWLETFQRSKTSVNWLSSIQTLIGEVRLFGKLNFGGWRLLPDVRPR